MASVMFDVISEVIGQGARELNITLPLDCEAALSAYYDFLTERGRFINLTAITDPKEVARLHFLDSIALLGAVSLEGEKIIDIGSGAGFPGVILKIARPDINLTLLDATGKKVTFLSELCEFLKVEADCVQARAEEISHRDDMREMFDIAVSRAVAELRMLCELCLPFVKVGGLMVSMKSINSDDEIKGAETAMVTLGAELENIYDYKIPGTEITHRAVLIRKEKSTPDEYPRRFARMQNFPL